VHAADLTEIVEEITLSRPRFPIWQERATSGSLNLLHKTPVSLSAFRSKERSMIFHEVKRRPENWAVVSSRLKRRWTVPFVAFEWVWAWLAFLLGNWSFLEVLEYLGRFSVLIAVILYFSESGDRIKQKHYQAWQVINTAQGKGGSGGRIEALQELNADRVPLVGVDASSAFLQGLRLERANLLRSDFSAADLRGSDLRSADLSNAELHSANFRSSNLEYASFEDADMSEADLWGCDLTGARLAGANLSGADLSFVNLSKIDWKQLSSIQKANIAGVKNAPEGFVDWALRNGAVQTREP
jgi:Pentapeptide repeats (8 copies)